MSDRGEHPAAYTRQAKIEYHGQVVPVLILRSFWRFRRVMIAVKGGTYRLRWIRAKRIWFYEQIDPTLWNNRKVEA